MGRNSCNNAYLFIMSTNTFIYRWVAEDQKDLNRDELYQKPTSGGAMQYSNYLHAGNCWSDCTHTIKKHPDAFKRGMFVYSATDDATQTNPLDASNSFVENLNGIWKNPLSTDFQCDKMCRHDQLSSVYKSVVAMPTFCPANNDCGGFLKEI